MKTYYAYWYEMDEYDQWLQSSEHETKEEAMRAAFKNASKHGVHLYAEVHETTLKDLTNGPETTGSWVNSCDLFDTRWSGWITKEKYERLCT